MVTKEKILSAVNEMPNEVDLDELFERLIFIQKVEEGLEDARDGRVTSAEELLKEVKTWGR